MSALYQPTDTLIESFINPDGSFEASWTLDPAQRIQVPLQRHVDIRTFVQEGIHVPTDQYILDMYTQAQLEMYNQGQLEGYLFSAIEGENWTNGVVGPQSDHANLNGITFTGSTTSYMETPIDIMTGFTDQGNLEYYVSLACPSLPAEVDWNPAISYVTLSSNPTGDLTGSDTVSVAFSSSAVSLNYGADAEVRLLRSFFDLGTIDLTQIHTVKIAIAGGSPSFRIMAIRMLPNTWDAAPVDIDTRYHRLVRSVTRTSNLSDITFPVSTTAHSIETDWPVLYRQLDGQSVLIDISHSVRFNTGSMVEGTNKINLYYRSLASEASTQGYLDTLLMSDLDALGGQPDFETSGITYVGYTMAEMDLWVQSYLDTLTMEDLDLGAPTSISGDWLEVDLSWGTSAASLEVKDQDTHSYSFVPALVANTNYVLFVKLIQDTIHMQIYGCDVLGNIDWTDLVFDSTTIQDGEMIRVIDGQVAWYAHLVDGDAACYGINADYTNYGQYLSNPLRSQTPVTGVSLYTEASPNQVLSQILTSANGATVALDVSKSPTAYKITLNSALGNEGAVSNPFWVYDWENTVIQFSLFVPSSVETAPLSILLLNADHNLTQIPIPFYIPNVWQSYSITPSDLNLTGDYELFFIQPGFNSTVFWIDNYQVFTRAFSWKARGHGEDYLLLDDTTDWVNFDDAHDLVNTGATLNDRSTSVLVGGEQLLSTANINALSIVPNYVNKSNFSWFDESLVPASPPTAAFTTSTVVPDILKFDGTSSSGPETIISWNWAFGDSTYGSGPVVNHIFATSGTYYVTLTVKDVLGNSNAVTHQVIVNDPPTAYANANFPVPTL